MENYAVYSALFLSSSITLLLDPNSAIANVCGGCCGTVGPGGFRPFLPAFGVNVFFWQCGQPGYGGPTEVSRKVHEKPHLRFHNSDETDKEAATARAVSGEKAPEKNLYHHFTGAKPNALDELSLCRFQLRVYFYMLAFSIAAHVCWFEKASGCMELVGGKSVK